jgi:hypothetical protein
MKIPILVLQELFTPPAQAEPPEQAEPKRGSALVLPSQEVAQGSGRPGPRLIPAQLSTAKTAATGVEPDEILVADVRGGLTPAQMVEQKLLALLGGSYRGLFCSATDRPGNRG